MKKVLTILVLCVVALCLLGLVMLYSTAFKPADLPRFRLQLDYLAAGLLLVPTLVRMDYGWLNQRPVLWVMGTVCFVLLLAVFIPGVGIQVNGANRWVRGAGQPSEFAKPVVITLLAAYLARLTNSVCRPGALTGQAYQAAAQRKTDDFKRSFLIPLLVGGVPALLIFAEQDWGTATLFGMITLALLLLAGARWSFLALTLTGAVSSLIVLVAFNPLRLERFLVFLDPEGHRRGAGWQIWQSLLAIGSGGVGGHFLDGSLHKYGYVPEQQTDFIFACIGEETGLWGSSVVLLLYLGILLCGLHILSHARDRFGYFLAAGCTTAITLQACINVAVATSLVPNKGLPLPFMSYGGSSLLAMFICIGLLGSVAWHSHPGRVPLRNSARHQPSAVQLVMF